jgi:hypothetical protein
MLTHGRKKGELRKKRRLPFISQVSGKVQDRYRFMLSSGLKYKCREGAVNLRKKAPIHRGARKENTLLL